LIAAPSSSWSLSAIGFLAPAYTPLVWLLGLALLMQRLHWRSPYRWWFYLTLSACFLATHISHAAIVFMRLRHVSAPEPARTGIGATFRGDVELRVIDIRWVIVHLVELFIFRHDAGGLKIARYMLNEAA
jgi:hypothetical protein